MKRAILYVIAIPIILILAAMLIPARSGGRPTQQQTCGTEMRFISDALQHYQNETGEYPTGQTSQILQQLRATNKLGNSFVYYPFRQGHSINEYVDPWGTPFRIEVGRGSNYLIISAGKDGRFGDNNDLIFDYVSNKLIDP